MMNDLYKLLFFTPTTHKSLGLISDNKLKNIHNYLVDVDLLTLRLAQLKYNTRVRNNEADWWDDLEVYIGLPTYNVRNLDLLNLSTSVPFGLLYDILNISTSNQNISILHKWNIFDVDELCHTDVDEFSMYCLAQEYNIEKSDGIFANYSQKIWGIPQVKLIEQLVDHPHKNLIKKKTLAIIEILQFRQGFQGYQSLKAALKVFKLLKNKELHFSDIEGFVCFEREELPDHGKYTNEHKPIEDFDLNDFFEFGTLIIELSRFYDDDFDHFLNYIQKKISDESSEAFSENEKLILKDLCEKYLRNQESLNS